MSRSTAPLVELSDAQIERYARHLVMPEIDEEGQLALLNSRVAVVGGGGLGCAVVQSLAAAGLGHITVFDADVVELSNLQRQVLHTTADIGNPKVASIRAAVAALNPDVRLDARQVMVTAETAQDQLADFDIIVDGCDNAPTRLAVADAAEALGTPLVAGAIFQSQGQMTTLKPYEPGQPRLLDFFPDLASPRPGQSCSEVGVFAPLCPLLGAWMASEVIKERLSLGQGLTGRLLMLDLMAARVQVFQLAASAPQAYQPVE